MLSPSWPRRSPAHWKPRCKCTPDRTNLFFEDDHKQVVDYKTERMVRICTGQSRHLVPLKVTYNERTVTLGSGECIRIEARKVFFEPTERLEPNWVIQADVDTMN